MIKHRYYQPKNSKDALRYVERLFNRYRNAPLTQALLEYHEKLTHQIRDNIEPVAKQEGIPSRVQSARRMEQIMQQWVRIRLSGQRFPGKVRHFQINQSHHKFKAHRIRLSSGHHFRSSQH